MANRQDFKNWLAASSRDWNQQCQALMWRLCEAFGSVPVDGIDSAIAAYNIEKNAGRISGGDAPAGNFVYFAIGTYGHVGFMLENGEMLSATKNNTEQWGINAGINTVAGYVAATGARYLGWSPLNGGNPLPFESSAPAPQPPAPSAEWDFGQQYADQARIQQALKNRGRYDGPVDGEWGPNSIKGIQTTIKNVGYTGPIDGIPGPNTCYFVQVYAQKFGDYTGPVDKVLGPNSWAGFALGLERP